jgi:predicted small lipoprotein YifL
MPMRIPPTPAVLAGALLLALAGCGNSKGPDGLTDDQRDRLNQHAAELDGADVIDASPDSLVANEEAVEEEIGAPDNRVEANAQ